MAATVLNSPYAIEMSVFVVRACVQMRQALIANQHVLLKLSELEERLDSHDAEIQDIVEAVRERPQQRIVKIVFRNAVHRNILESYRTDLIEPRR